MAPAALARAYLAGDAAALARADATALAAATPAIVRALARTLHDRNQFAQLDEARLAAGVAAALTAIARGDDAAAALAAEAAARPMATTALVTCGTYAATLQLDVLGLDPATLRGPVLDVGCGPAAILVEALRGAGVDAHGVDRHLDAPAAHRREADWADAAGAGGWGTIVSHLGLSLHLLHHHAAGDATALVRVWRALTRALVPGGVMAYVPGLPMLERALPRGELTVIRRPLPEALEVALAPLARAVGEDVAYAVQLVTAGPSAAGR